MKTSRHDKGRLKKEFKMSSENESWNNPYQYTRAIRFRGNLIQGKENLQLEKEKKNQSLEPTSNDNLLSEFSKLSSDCYKKILDILFDSEKHKDATNKKNSSVQSEENQHPIDSKKFKGIIYVKKQWLKQYHKNIFYEGIKNKENKQGKYQLNKDLKIIHSGLKEELKNWESCNITFESTDIQSKRESDVSFCVRSLKKPVNYFLILLEEMITKNSSDLDQKIENSIDNLKKLKDKISSIEWEYHSSMSGVEIGKSSFNYYTVNKKPKKYYEGRIEDVRKDLYCSKSNSGSCIENTNKGFTWKIKKDDCIFTFKTNQEKEWLKRYYHKKILKKENEHTDSLPEKISLSLDETYTIMKAFKAEQRSIFFEMIDHILSGKKELFKVNNKNHFLKGYSFKKVINSVDTVNEEFSLFQFGDKWSNHYKEKFKPNPTNKKGWYEVFLNVSRKIQKLSKDKQKNNSQKNISHNIQRLKKERGFFLFGKNCYFNCYGKFCDKYQKIAQERGKLKSQLKGIEKEKLESTQTQFWSFIYCSGGKKQIWMVPKEKMQKTKEFIENKLQNSTDQPNQDYLCVFKSLTKRALHKLCYASESSFRRDLLKEHTNLENLYKKSIEYKTEGNKDKILEKNKLQIQFLKETLKTDYAQKVLSLQDFELDSVFSVTELDEFEKELEKKFYKIKKLHLNKDDKEEFLSKFDPVILDITSYDLEGRNQKMVPNSKNRFHTELWKSFWNSANTSEKDNKIEHYKVGEVRLNPEVKIFYRKKDDELKNYFNKKNYPEKFKHRRLQDQFTLCFTLSLNAGKYEDLAFSKPEELSQKIDSFNKEFNTKRSFKESWKYGIDRGNNELATLCLTKGISNDPDLEKFKCYTLKDYSHSKTYTNKNNEEKIKFAIHNLSYFIENEDLFDIQETSCLDLTTAKLIKGRIVTNGDVMTYLKLKKESAKRKLYDLHSQGKISSKNILKESSYIDGDSSKVASDDVLNINIPYGKNQETTIYHYDKVYEGIPTFVKSEIKKIYSKDDIKRSLSNYLTELKNSGHSRHTPSIERVNHLRDALVANMIGIICYLFEKYLGFIILEDLGKGRIDGHFDRSNENLSRRLEYALYSKFQTLGLVPPHVKNIIQLREKKSKNTSHQIGNIVFTPKENTSKKCPACKKVVQQHPKLKYKQKRFLCDQCGFDTYLFRSKEETRDKLPAVKSENFEKFEHLKNIDDPDKVAAYNIARNISDINEIESWQKKDSSNNKSKSKNKKVRNANNYQNQQSLTHRPFKDLKDNILSKKELDGENL